MFSFYKNDKRGFAGVFCRRLLLSLLNANRTITCYANSNMHALNYPDSCNAHTIKLHSSKKEPTIIRKWNLLILFHFQRDKRVFMMKNNSSQGLHEYTLLHLVCLVVIYVWKTSFCAAKWHLSYVKCSLFFIVCISKCMTASYFRCYRDFEAESLCISVSWKQTMKTIMTWMCKGN